MQAVELLDKFRNNIQISVITTISAENLDEIVKLAEWTNGDSRIETIIFQAIAQPFNVPFDDNWHMREEYNFLWPKDKGHVNSKINDLVHLKREGYKISNSVKQLEDFKKYFEKPQEFIKKTSCNVDFYMNINPLGDIFMCTRKEPIGNIKKNSPKEIWFSEEADKRREEISNCRINCHHLINCCYEEERSPSKLGRA